MTVPWNNDPFESSLKTAMPVSLVEWRERVLDGVLRATFIVWVIVLLVGIYETFQSGQWPARPAMTLATALVYALAGVAMGVITFRRQLSFGLRSGVILAMVYVLGAIGLATRGIAGDGRLYFLTFVTLVAIFFDVKRSLIALGMSILSIVAVRFAGAWDYFQLLPKPTVEFLPWLIGLLLFLLLSVAMILAIAFLIRSLDRSLAESYQERNFVSAILETAGALVVLFDLDGRIMRFNRACEEITGFSFAEVREKHVWDVFLTPGGIDLTRLVFEQVKEGGLPSSYECHWLTKDGKRRLIAWSTTALRDQRGTIEYIVSTGIDITVHQQAEAERERLLAAEHEQRLIAEALAEITLALTSQTSPTAVLDEILRRAQRVVPFRTANILLLEGETLRSVRWQGYEIFGGEEAIANFLQPLHVYPLVEEVVQNRTPLVVQDTRQEPRWSIIEEMGWIRSHLIVPIVLQESVLGLLRLDGNMPGEFSEEDARRLQPLANAAAIALENARLHQETMRQARRVRQILDSSHDGILLLDASHHIELTNPAAEGFLESLANISSNRTLISLGGQSLAKLLEPPPDGMLWHELALGRERRIFEAVAHPLRAGTEARGWVLVLREVTEARKQQQYIQAQERLAMVGQLAAGIAHDFNNIMTVIILYAQMLMKREEFASGEDQRMGIIFRQANLAANLIAQILDFSRQSVMERRPVNLVFFLKELIKMLKRTLPENIKLELIYDEAEYGISADLTRLQQAVMNLAVNARDAMLDGGTLSMVLDTLTIELGAKPPLPDMEPGKWVLLAVEDTGQGIKLEDLERVFEPFFTTKGPGHGTGLGLAQVYGIVKQHDGFVGLKSEEGVGTTFTIYLPSLVLADVLEPVEERSAIAEGDGETILVVEDDENTREAVCDILQALNYQAMAAADAEQALGLFERYHDEIALVISDMVMPGMSGSKLYTRLRDVEPDIKMVVVTGYPFDEQDKASLSQGIVAWVQKPFVMEQIAAAIREALAV